MDFINFCTSIGLVVRYLEKHRWVRVPTIDHPRKKNGAYFYDGLYGVAQNWAQMAEAAVWHSKQKLQPHEMKRMEVMMRQARDERNRTQAELNERAAKRAMDIVAEAKVEQHAYLDSKGFPKMRGLVWYPEPEQNLLVIPMRIKSNLVGAQLIDRDGEKKFLSGQRASLAQHILGQGTKHFWVEGYATGISLQALLHHKINYCIHVTFSAGNLTKLAKAFGAGVVIADNDKSEAGEKAAVATGLPYWLPPAVGMDLNDFHCEVGQFNASMALNKFLRRGVA